MATVTGIVLAAGASERMGKSKLLLPFSGSTVLNATIAAVKASAVGRVIVVTGARAEEVEASLGNLTSSSPSFSSPSGGGADEGGGGGQTPNLADHRSNRGAERSEAEGVKETCQAPAPNPRSPVAGRQPEGSSSLVVVRNPDYRRGNMSSLLTATAADPQAEAFIIVPGDLPTIRSDVIDFMLDLWFEERPWAAVTEYRDRIAHPFLLSRTAVKSMEEMTGEKVLGRILIDSNDDRVVRLPAPQRAPRDVNTPEDYAELFEES
ncbi:MAG: nucleotidyltransferase family protein [Actinomycetota bacterium]|nr:nucleotidyltransferase family protein [Actinomycetota bacterium]